MTRRKVSRKKQSSKPDVADAKPTASRQHIWLNLFAFIAICVLLVWLMYETDLIRLFTEHEYLERFLSRLNPLATIAVFIILQSLQVVLCTDTGERSRDWWWEVSCLVSFGEWFTRPSG